MSDEFYEEDEALEEILNAFATGEGGLTEGHHNPATTPTVYFPFEVVSDQSDQRPATNTYHARANTQPGDLVSA